MLIGRRESQESPAGAAALVLEHPDRAVRSLCDAANSLAHPETLGFSSGLAVDLNAHERLRRKTPDKSISLPLGKLAAAVEYQARR